MTKHYICSRYPGTDYYEFKAALPSMQPGDSVRVTMTDDEFYVVRTVKFGMSPERDVLWVDAPEQENDR